MLFQKHRQLYYIVKPMIKRDSQMRSAAVNSVHRAADNLVVHTLGIDFYASDLAPIGFYMSKSAVGIDRSAFYFVLALADVRRAPVPRREGDNTVFLSNSGILADYVTKILCIIYQFYGLSLLILSTRD